MRIKSDYELEQQWESTVNTRMNNKNQQQHEHQQLFLPAEHHQLCPSFLGLFFVGHYPTHRYNCYNKGSIPIQSSITPEHRFDDHARKVWCIIKMLVDDTKHSLDWDNYTYKSWFCYPSNNGFDSLHEFNLYRWTTAHTSGTIVGPIYCGHGGHSLTSLSSMSPTIFCTTKLHSWRGISMPLL